MKVSDAFLASFLIGGVVYFTTLSSSFCACDPTDDLFHSKIGVNPMTESPEKSKKAFLEKVPIGTPKPEVMKEVDGFLRKTHGQYCKPNRDSGAHTLRCRFPVETSFFSSRGIFLVMNFDEAEKLQGLQLGRFDK